MRFLDEIAQLQCSGGWTQIHDEKGICFYAPNLHPEARAPGLAFRRWVLLKHASHYLQRSHADLKVTAEVRSVSIVGWDLLS